MGNICCFVSCVRLYQALKMGREGEEQVRVRREGRGKRKRLQQSHCFFVFYAPCWDAKIAIGQTSLYVSHGLNPVF